MGQVRIHKYNDWKFGTTLKYCILFARKQIKVCFKACGYLLILSKLRGLNKGPLPIYGPGNLGSWCR